MRYVLSAVEVDARRERPLILVSDSGGKAIGGVEAVEYLGAEHSHYELLNRLLLYVQQLILDDSVGDLPEYPKLLSVPVHDLPTWEGERCCSWQHGESRNLLCAASDPDDRFHVLVKDGLFFARTGRAICGKCSVPDDRILCDNFSHPHVMVAVGGRSLNGFFCQVGQESSAKSGSECRPGGRTCWQQTVALSRSITSQRYPAIALPDAFDQLDAVWRLRNGKNRRLVRQESAVVVAGLAQDCTNTDEFKARFDDLADMLDRLSVDDDLLDSAIHVDVGSLNRLEAWIQQNLSDESKTAALRAMGYLRAVRNARRSFAHANRRSELSEQLVLLGVELPFSDYSDAWAIVRSEVIVALRDLRKALV